MSDTNNPFIPGPGVLLSMSTCAVIGEVVARELKATGGYSTAAILDRAGLPDDPAVLIDAEQVATLLAVSRDAVFNLARRHHDPLPSRKIGRSRRFVRGEVDHWSTRQR